MKRTTPLTALTLAAILAATLTPVPLAAFDIGGVTPVLTFPEGAGAPAPETTTRGRIVPGN